MSPAPLDRDKFIKRHPVRWHVQDIPGYLLVTDANSEVLLAADVSARTEEQRKQFHQTLRIMVDVINAEYHW